MWKKVVDFGVGGSPTLGVTLEQSLLSAVVALAGCVGGLFAWFKTQFGIITTKLSECEEDREKLWRHIALLSAAAGPQAAETMHQLKP